MLVLVGDLVADLVTVAVGDAPVVGEIDTVGVLVGVRVRVGVDVAPFVGV